MDPFEQKLQDYIFSHHIQAELLKFNQSCHSVKDASLAVGGSPEDFVKNICFIDKLGNLLVAIVKGEDRVSMEEIGNALGIIPPRIATAEEILIKVGYPCGGVPSFGYQATFLIDPKVMEKEIVYTGGGSVTALVKIGTEELQKANQGRVFKIRK